MGERTTAPVGVMRKPVFFGNYRRREGGKLTVIQVLEILTKHAAEYRIEAAESIKQNSYTNKTAGDTIKQCYIDAILVDFINFIGIRHGIDYALYTRDLPKHTSQDIAKKLRTSVNNAKSEVFVACLDCEFSGYGKYLCRKCAKTLPVA